MAGEAVIDAEIVDEPAQQAVSTEVTRRERRSEVLKPLDPDTLLESFTAYQGLLQRLLTPEDWQGNPNAKGSFVKKKGWRKIATAFDLDVLMIRSEVERAEDGTPLRAEVWARAVAPSGRSMDGDGYCSADERRFADAGGRQKLENDLRATATTRAMNRAISGLIGMGDVSAEEVDSAPTAGPPFGEAADDVLGDKAVRALSYLLGEEPDSDTVNDLLLKLKQDADGYYPRIVLRAIGLVAAERQRSRAEHLAREAGE